MSIFRCVLADLGGPAERGLWSSCQDPCATDPEEGDGKTVHMNTDSHPQLLSPGLSCAFLLTWGKISPLVF